MQRESAPNLAAESRLTMGDFVLDLARGELLDPAGQPADLRAQALRVSAGARRARRAGGRQGRTASPGLGRRHRHRGLARAGGRRHPAAPGRPWPRSAAHRAAAGLPSGIDAAAPPTTPPPASRRRRSWMAAGAALAMLLLVVAAWQLRDEPAPPRTLAILPFESDTTGADDDAWFVDAITGDLNTMVARWRSGLEVVGRGTMQRYKGQAADPRTVGRDLGVAHVLTGRVRREGARVRIAVELVDAGNREGALGQALRCRSWRTARFGGRHRRRHRESAEHRDRRRRHAPPPDARPGPGRRGRPGDARLVGAAEDGRARTASSSRASFSSRRWHATRARFARWPASA